jgi:opacity protein-like surface antigen
MKLLVASLLIFASLMGAHAGAQAIPVGSTPLSIEVGGGFTSIHANAGPGVCGCFFMNGFDAQAGVYGSSRISALIDVGRTKRSNVNGFGHNIMLATYMTGGKYTLNRGGRFSPYGEALVGFGASESNFPIDQKTVNFAFAGGGGLNLKLTQHLDFRVAEAQYLVTHIPNGVNDRQNQLRLTSGISYHFHIHR